MNELRELDALVHRALYPDDDVSHILNFGPRLTYVKDRVFRTSSRRWMRLPRYSTDIGAWDAVCALKPEWLWDQAEYLGESVVVGLWWADGDCVAEDVLVTDATGLAAYALGRARCVLAWAAGRGEG